MKRQLMKALCNNSVESPLRRQDLFRNSRVNRILLAVLLLPIASCASSPDLWYKTGGTQNSFNLDSRECEIIAEQFSLLQGETGKRIDPVNFSQNYLQCINGKGWSRTKPVTPATDIQTLSPQPEFPVDLKERTLNGFGLHITLPESFTLVSTQESAIGPTVIRQFFWKNQNGVFINIIFQENNKSRFDIIPYPIADAYELYTSGIGAKAKELLQWSTFFGKIRNEWVMGTGSFYLADKNKRLIIVITKNLDPPSDTPPANLTLSRNQHDQIEAFSNNWSAWLESQFPQKTGLWNWLKTTTD